MDGEKIELLTLNKDFYGCNSTTTEQKYQFFKYFIGTQHSKTFTAFFAQVFVVNFVRPTAFAYRCWHLNHLNLW